MKYNGLRKYNSDNTLNETHQKIFEKRIQNSKFKKLFMYLYAQNISLQSLSQRSGIALSKISEMRRGADCNTSTLTRLREALGTSMDEII